MYEKLSEITGLKTWSSTSEWQIVHGAYLTETNGYNGSCYVYVYRLEGLSRKITTKRVSRYDTLYETCTYIGLVPVVNNRRQVLLLSSSFFSRPLFEPFLHLGSAIRQPQTRMYSYLFSLPTLTVAIIRKSGPGSERAKHVNSKKLECSEYGTPMAKHRTSRRSRPIINDRSTHRTS